MGLCMASLTDGAICFVFFFSERNLIWRGRGLPQHSPQSYSSSRCYNTPPPHMYHIYTDFFSFDIIPLFYCVFSNPLDLHVTHFLPICIFCLPLAGISTAIHNSLIAISRSLSLFWNFLFSLSLHIFTSTLFPPHPLLCGYFFVSSTLLNCTPPGG